MEGPVHILFYDNALIDYLFGHLAISKGLTVSSGKSRERVSGICLRVAINNLISGGGKLESSVVDEDKITREANDLELLARIWATPELKKQIPNYHKAIDDFKVQKNHRVVKIEGKVSWLPRKDKNVWYGDIVSYKDTDKSRELIQIILRFSDPGYDAPIVPESLHGCNATVLSFWNPYFYEDCKKQIRECSVIAVFGN